MLYHMPSGRSQVELGENTNQLDKNIIILEREKKIIMRLPLRPQLSIKACCAPEPSPGGGGAGGGRQDRPQRRSLKGESGETNTYYRTW